MKKNMILLLTFIPLLGALQATDVDVAAADHADNSQLGDTGYFNISINPFVGSSDKVLLTTDTALTTNTIFNRSAARSDHSYLQRCLQAPANNDIFKNAKAFGVLFFRHFVYAVLNNDRTYFFYATPENTNTAPLRYIQINNGDIRHLLGYTSNPELIRKIFESIIETGKIDSSLWPSLGYTPPTTSDPSLLAAAASAVVAIHGGGEAGAAAGAGAGAGRVSPSAHEENMRIQVLAREHHSLQAQYAEQQAQIAVLESTIHDLRITIEHLKYLLKSAAPDQTDQEIEESLALLRR